MSDRPLNFFFAVTGFQLLTALEAREQMAANERSILFLPKSLAARSEPLLKGWESVQLLDEKLYYRGGPAVFRWFPTVRSATRLIRKLDPPSRVFLGYDGEVPRAFAAATGSARHVLLEDGTATLVALPSLMRQASPAADPHATALRRLVKRSLYGIQPRSLHYDYYFTMFDLGLDVASSHGKLVRNQFRWLNGHLRRFSDERVLLGSPFVEHRMLYRDDYVNAIRAVYESTKVETYIPHPSERARSGVWEAATSMGMQVRRPETFFELDCVQKEAMPALTVTFGSTASYLLAALGHPERTAIFWAQNDQGLHVFRPELRWCARRMSIRSVPALHE